MENSIFTSDTHFNHANILKLCNRPFKSVEEMYETMIANWNCVVGMDNDVFHLGDFCLGGAAEWTKMLDWRFRQLHFRHQVRAAEEAEDADGVILIEYPESP